MPSKYKGKKLAPRPGRAGKRGPLPKFTKARQEAFLEEFGRTGLIVKSARAVGVSYETIRKYRIFDEEFQERFDEADMEFQDSIEAEAIRRGRDGVQRPLMHQGRLTGDHVTEYSDNLLIEVLRARNARFARKQKLDVNVKAGVMLVPRSEPGDWYQKHGLEKAETLEAEVVGEGKESD